MSRPKSQAHAAHERAAHEHAETAMIADLRGRGLRMTPQRLAIVRLFAADPSHPTAQELFDRLRAAFPTMSFATVYNTLDALAKAGLSKTLRLGNAARFDPNVEPHHHAICDRCGAIIDVPSHDLAPDKTDTRAIDRSAPGFAVATVERVYRGTCASCT